MSTAPDRAAFIRANTTLMTPPLVPQIKLHLAAESLPIWQKTEDELGQMNVPPPFWAFAWAGGQALARYILDNPQVAAGKSVIDLGTGCGIAAIAAAMAGAASVLAADIDEMSLAAVQMNAAANNVALQVTGADLLAAPPPPAVQLVLVADLFYERLLAERVTAFIAAAGEAGADILVGDPRRTYFPATRFGQVAVFQVPVSRELEDAEIKTTSVWRLIS